MSTTETFDESRRPLVELGLDGPLRFLTPWAGYVLLVLAGRAIAGGSVVETGALVVGLPIAWLVGWTWEKRPAAGTAALIVLAVAGLAVGLLVGP